KKIDMIDYADMVILNKYDKRGAEDALRDIRKQWQRNHNAFAVTAEQIPEDVEAFEAAALKKHGIDFAPVPPRYRTAYFAHIWGGGYSSSYYAYIWSEVLAADAFAFMKENGGCTRENGDRIRSQILSRGSSRDPMDSWKAFRGREPEVESLLIRRGLK
ncbi:MAG: M3 family metallopeptidase, partial [Planctomycetaceae bacterium]